MPLNLKNKLCNMEGIVTTKSERLDVTRVGDYHRQYVQGPTWAELELELIDIDSINACNEWFLNMSSVDIGPYKGIIPKSIHTCCSHSTITFHIREVDLNAGSWEDWFIQDEMFIESEGAKG